MVFPCFAVLDAWVRGLVDEVDGLMMRRPGPAGAERAGAEGPERAVRLLDLAGGLLSSGAVERLTGGRGGERTAAGRDRQEGGGGGGEEGSL
jgi:hypothetical protein